MTPQQRLGFHLRRLAEQRVDPSSKPTVRLIGAVRSFGGEGLSFTREDTVPDARLLRR
ncbi:MAG: hypothetical protein KF773_38960 [Deltaproteobacteria bacterium]|nr:hypothetical protein [Deltaproteobacteria bacterium]MCW5808116.1 hypothetical protein [Deltaproteobacteria bacterium]